MYDVSGISEYTHIWKEIFYEINAKDSVSDHHWPSEHKQVKTNRHAILPHSLSFFAAKYCGVFPLAAPSIRFRSIKNTVNINKHSYISYDLGIAVFICGRLVIQSLHPVIEERYKQQALLRRVLF